MNDIILSSLLNLFALFGAKNKTDRGKSEKIISDYLINQFGVRDLDSSLDLYSELRELYEDMPDLDVETFVTGICSKLQGLISAEEQTLMLLRLIEVYSTDKDSIVDSDSFKCVADSFNIDDSVLNDLITFVENDRVSDNVRMFPYGGDDGYVKTLYLRNFNEIVFAYHGSQTVRMNDVPVHPGAFQIWERSGVMKSQKDKTLYYINILQPFKEADGVSEPKINLFGDHVDFHFSDNTGNGIHNFTFELHNGELVAIMGGSGVGKSTLLSLLNGTLRPQTGSITINGHDINEEEAKMQIGFVPQDDLLIEELTVYQNLWFTAKLCFDGTPEEELDKKVMGVLQELGLEAVRDLKVGSPINKTISGGQRKRLNIALELIREPSVLYLDEPTSGLSSADTEMVVNLLKEQAFKGKMIITNIHQPSSDVFKLFDRLWILDKGGYPIYDGNPIEAVTYFKQAANYADADVSTCPVCGNVNPEIILNIIDEKSLSDTGGYTSNRKKSPQEWHDLYLKSVESKIKNSKAKEATKLPKTEQHRPNPLKQVGIFLMRNLKAKITNLQYILITLLEAPILAFICAYLTHQSVDGEYCIMNNSNLVSYYFMAIIVATFLGMSGSAEEIIKDRALLKREKFLNLSYRSYIWSKILFMAAVCLVQTLLFIVVGSLVMGITDLFFTWWLILFVTALLAALTGLLLSQCMNSIVAIYITIPLLLIPQILLCGLVVSFSDLNTDSKTGNVPLLGDVIPSRWAFEALAVTSFSDNDYEVNFFNDDKERYTAQFYRNSYIYEVESQLETMKSKEGRLQKSDSIGQSQEEKDNLTTDIQNHQQTIKNSLPVIAKVCGIEPYNGDYTYQSLKTYLENAENLLASRGNTATLELDKRIGLMIRHESKEALTQLKRDHYNLQLETLVLNSKTSSLCKIVDNTIVPQVGYIYLEPQSHNGRAPFYSSEKILGNLHIKTLWFNISVLILMGLIVAICLFNDFPGRRIRKERN